MHLPFLNRSNIKSPLRSILSTPGLVGAWFPWMDVNGRNVLEVGSENPANWDSYYHYGGTPTITASQADPDGGTSAYRLQVTGGTQLTKAGTHNITYVDINAIAGVWIKVNSGTCWVNFTVGDALTGGVKVIPSEGWVHASVPLSSIGVRQLRLLVKKVSDNLDVTIYQPQINLNSTLYPYSAPVGLPQVLTDFSGHGNHAQLGSTTGADTNDPTWEANALLYDSDDIAYSPVISSMSHSSGWSAFLALTTTGSDTHFSVGNLSPDWQPFVSVERWGSSGTLRVYNTSSGKTKGMPTNAFETVQPCLIYLKYSGGISYFRSMDTADITEIEHTLPNKTPQVVFNARAYNGGTNRSSASRQYLSLVFNRVTTSNEDAKIYAAVKAILASQGVTIA